MILKNKNGKEREFELLLEINKDNNKYLVYKDYLTDNIYSGKLNNNKLDLLDDNEYEYINNLIKRIDG